MLVWFGILVTILLFEFADFRCLLFFDMKQDITNPQDVDKDSSKHD